MEIDMCASRIQWGMGAFGCTNLGNVLSEIARIVTTQTAHLIGISTSCTVFIASHWISCNFIEKHRKPLCHKGLSRVKQGNLLPFRCRDDEKPCKSRVYKRWYGWFLNGRIRQSGRSEKFFIFFLRFTEQIPPFFDIIYRGVILLPSRVKVEP